MPFSFRLPIYQKVARDELGVSSTVSGAQLYQLMKAGSHGDLNGLSADQNTRRAQLLARMQTNVGGAKLAKYVSSNENGNVVLTPEAQALIKKDKRKKTILGVIRTIAAPTIIGGLAVHKAYQERRDDDKYAATDITPALRNEIRQVVRQNRTMETVTALMNKYGLSQHDVVTLSIDDRGNVPEIKGLYPSRQYAGQ
jgi:hypothetical protein